MMTMTPADVAAHKAASYVRTPLPKPAAEALARLERTSIAPQIVKAVTQYTTAALRVVELSDIAVLREMTRLDARALMDAEDLVADALAVLTKAGRLDLIGGA